MTEINYVVSLAYLYPESSWTMENNDYATLDWLDESTPKPTKAKLTNVYDEALYHEQLTIVTEARRIAYQLESDPLNFKYQETELAEDKAAWLAKKEEIKARYPEPVQGE